MTVFGKNANELAGKDKQRLGVTLSGAGFSDYLNIERCNEDFKENVHWI